MAQRKFDIWQGPIIGYGGAQQVFPQEANSNAQMTSNSLQDQSAKMSLPRE